MHNGLRLLVLLLLQGVSTVIAQSFTPQEITRFKTQSQNVTIIRDKWGIPHVYGKTDADAVFGLMYAQCEDDFKRIELNYIEKLGRMSELTGEADLYNDLYIRLIIDSAEAIADYNKAPAWLKQLLNAFADGINYYLHTHKAVKPLLLKKFQPWYPLLWTDGSIGAISTGDITAAELKDFYTNNSNLATYRSLKQEYSSGSNGFAVAPSKTASGNAILYINPHVTFYFRPEVHVVSKAGLNAYGAATWGQFFVYQGFNEHCGWMHTSSNVDVSDMYEEDVVKTNNGIFYHYDGGLKKMLQKEIVLHYTAGDSLVSKKFTAWFTHHGPVMTKRNGKYISVRSLNRSSTSLIQSWQRTKATGLDSYKQNMALTANTSNNTVFADSKGNIAYWHGNYVPKRDARYNWSLPVDGTITATEWQGLHSIDELVHVYNPSTAYIQNCNATPFTVSGSASPLRSNYLPYMAPDGENFRGINAARLLDTATSITIDKMIELGYNKKLAAFEILVPALTRAFDQNIHPGDSLFTVLTDAIGILKKWHYDMDENSVAVTLAIEWAEKLPANLRRVYIDEGEKDQVQTVQEFAATATPEQLLQPLVQTIQQLTESHGTWQVKWGTINRYQRISGDVQPHFSDSAISYPVPFASSTWGALPSYVSRYFNNSNKRYGVSGNSFICVVEFGNRIKAKSLLAGGNSGNAQSLHFTDQLEMYSKGQFKEVLFYKEDVLRYAEKKYHPGE
ncbi:MAG TPA: penicillin acylase family protein [Ferruginibacter sp.]|nr:penicillin acylase family protein [Ferruginibacter sp.]HMP19714.1 penicillin acylase family protein [Ferruginibacter sp.]